MIEGSKKTTPFSELCTHGKCAYTVSDIVVLHENRENSAHFVDTFGFTGLPQFLHELEEKAEDLTVTFTVAECGEFHGIGAYYEDIPTIEDAIRIYRKMDPARLNGVPAIGVNLHVEGTDCLEDDQVDLLTGKTIDVDFLNYMPDVRDHPSVQDAIKKLVEAFPEKEVNDRETKEQNYNMIDNVLNNGVEKFNRKEDKQKLQQGRTSLKERLCAKQCEVSEKQGRDPQDQNKVKKNSREM